MSILVQVYNTMNAADRSKNVQDYYASIVAAKAKKLDSDFAGLVNAWSAGPVGSQPPGNLGYLIVRYTDCELVAVVTGVTEQASTSAAEKCTSLGYSVETLTSGDTSYFHVYSAESLSYMLTEYPDYTLFTV